MPPIVMSLMFSWCEALEPPLPPLPSVMQLQEAWSCGGPCWSSVAMSWHEAAASVPDQDKVGPGSMGPADRPLGG